MNVLRTSITNHSNEESFPIIMYFWYSPKDMGSEKINSEGLYLQPNETKEIAFNHWVLDIPAGIYLVSAYVQDGSYNKNLLIDGATSFVEIFESDPNSVESEKIGTDIVVLYTTGTLTINSPKVINDIQVFDLSGKLLAEKQSLQQSVSLSVNLPSNSRYLINIKTDNHCIVKSLFIPS